MRLKRFCLGAAGLIAASLLPVTTQAAPLSGEFESGDCGHIEHRECGLSAMLVAPWLSRLQMGRLPLLR